MWPALNKFSIRIYFYPHRIQRPELLLKRLHFARGTVFTILDYIFNLSETSVAKPKPTYENAP